MSDGYLKPVLVNFSERAADRLLTKSAQEHGDRLCTKVRVADVVDADRFEGTLKSYALRAHFDFVMIGAADGLARFAVELDGTQHFTDEPTRRRDAMKDSICERAGLPLLRITTDYLHKVGTERVLAYVIDAYYYAQAFYDAQDNGSTASSSRTGVRTGNGARRWPTTAPATRRAQAMAAGSRPNRSRSRRGRIRWRPSSRHDGGGALWVTRAYYDAAEQQRLASETYERWAAPRREAAEAAAERARQNQVANARARGASGAHKRVTVAIGAPLGGAVA